MRKFFHDLCESLGVLLAEVDLLEEVMGDLWMDGERRLGVGGVVMGGVGMVGFGGEVIGVVFVVIIGLCGFLIFAHFFI